MTARESYEHTLTELNKLGAPSVLLEDFVYFFNKAVQQYINLTYIKFELDQQSIDDLRVLKATTVITPQKIVDLKDKNNYENLTPGVFDNSYYVDLPEDYLHLLNCIVEFDVANKSNRRNCDGSSSGKKLYFAAKNLTTGLYTQIINNAYLKPNYNRPYYTISNINTVINNGSESEESLVASIYTDVEGLTATNKVMDEHILDYNKYDEEKGGPGGNNYDSEEEIYAPSNLVDFYTEPGDRLSNASTVRLELKFGDDPNYIPTRVYIDYIKSPMYVNLTFEQINSINDYSQILEFPDYVCFEIINIVTRLLLENASDPRLQTQMPLNNTIPNPAISK